MSTPTRHGMPDTLPPTPLGATTVPPSATKAPSARNPYFKKPSDGQLELLTSPSNKQPSQNSSLTMSTPARPDPPGTLPSTLFGATTVPPSATKSS
eukprot:scaffold8349_cov42-Attheya_sp.AAC.1